jgi:hypothetical protein
MPITPNKENGAKDFKFLSKQSGSKMRPVTTRRVGLRIVPSNLEKVSPRTMLYARQAKKVFKVVDHAGIHAVDSPIVLLQASLSVDGRKHENSEVHNK